VPATRSLKPRSILLRDAEIADTKRRATLVIDAEPAVTPIDLDALQPAEANIVPAASAEVVVAPLRKVHTTTMPARIRDSFADGEAIIGLAALIGIGAVTAIIVTIIYLVTAFVAAVVVILPAILSLLAVVVLVQLLFRDLGSGGKTAVVKGCPKGPTPGPIRIRR
jgi:hypothetical protein